MAELVNDEIKQHIMRYLSSGDTGPTQAVDKMKAKFGMNKLNKPVLLARLKNMKTAASSSQIPATPEAILTVLEALAQMEQETAVQHLPQDVLVHVFRALKLSVLEQKEVMPMITADSVTLNEVKSFVNDRMYFYYMWTRTFHKTDQEHKASLGAKNQAGQTQAGGAMGGELCSSPASHAGSPIPPTFNGAAL